jgi:cytochrome c biogenesis protein CcdA/glutaredoxin
MAGTTRLTSGIPGRVAALITVLIRGPVTCLVTCLVAGLALAVIPAPAQAEGLPAGATSGGDTSTAATTTGAPVAADRAADEAPVTLVLFHGEGCPHCAAERAWLAELARARPGVRIEQYEVWNDPGNRALLADYAERLGFEPVGVPVTVVGEEVWIGFSEGIAAEIDSAVASALADADGSGSSGASTAARPGSSVDLPIAGTVDLAGMSLLASTVLIGFADGINPCSLWVLAVLLAVVLHSGSRGRVALVGGTFLLVTAAMYGLYIVGMYSALDYAGGLGWIRAAVAALALVLGGLQLKDGLGVRGGPSLSMSAQRRPHLIRRMRAVARPDRGVVATMAGTAALAVGVSLLETPCTAGLPLLWTSMLADQSVAIGTAVALFGVYMLVFLVDELVLFGAAVVTMRARRLQASEGRALKILSGSLLVTLGVVMLVAPDAMTDLSTSLLVFATAAAVGGLLWGVARRRPPSAHGRGHLP